MSHDYQPITKSARIYGRYAIGKHELITGDVIEWLEDGTAHKGRVDYTYSGYFVRTPIGSFPLRELVQAQRMGAVRSSKR